METSLNRLLGLRMIYTGRDENASPAVGSSQISRQEQNRILDEALGPVTEIAEKPARTKTTTTETVEQKPTASRKKAPSGTGSKRRRRTNTKGSKKKAS